MTKYKQDEYDALFFDERPIITDVKVMEPKGRLPQAICIRFPKYMRKAAKKYFFNGVPFKGGGVIEENKNFF